MRKSVAFALLLIGALFIITPALSDHVYWQRFLGEISNPGVNATPLYTYFTARMDGHSQLAFWSTGFSAVLAAALFFRRRSVPSKT